MIGIKKHTHQERESIVEKLIPDIKKEFGDNFAALGSEGSFAKNTDIDYSDVELVVFVKKLPKERWILRRIIDGLYIVAVADTKKSYIEKYLEVTDIWYATGGNKILPIINKELIEEINNFKPKDLEKKCLEQIQKRWFRFQEIFAKTLNTIILDNREGFPIIFNETVKDLLIVLSFLNQSPYQTLGEYVAKAKKFKIKPKGFDELMETNTKGEYEDLNKIKKLVEEIFTEIESIMLKKN